MAERLGHLNSVLRSAVGESERLAASLARAEANIRADQEALEAVAARLAAAQEAPAEEEPSPEHRDALALAAAAARSAEMEARLSLRSAEEQLTAIRNRASSLERAAATERRAREEAAERARRRRLQAAAPPPCPPPSNRSSASLTCPWNWPAANATSRRSSASRWSASWPGCAPATTPLPANWPS